MTSDTSNQTPNPGSGAGSDSALEAMLKKRNGRVRPADAEQAPADEQKHPCQQQEQPQK